jgi:hypothetical protein
MASLRVAEQTPEGSGLLARHHWLCRETGHGGAPGDPAWRSLCLGMALWFMVLLGASSGPYLSLRHGLGGSSVPAGGANQAPYLRPGATAQTFMSTQSA